MALRARLRKLGLEDVIGFGKVPNVKVRVLIINDFRYISWMVENKHIVLDNTAMKLFKEQEELQEEYVSDDPADDLYWSDKSDWGGDDQGN